MGGEIVLLQAFVGVSPDGGGGSLVQQFVDPEVALQFEMSPVVKGIANATCYGGSPRQELLIGTGISRAETFGDTVGAHGPPFVVIAFQPDFHQIVKAAVAGNVVGWDVAVIVHNGQPGGVFVIQMFGGFVAQKEVIMNKWHGWDQA